MNLAIVGPTEQHDDEGQKIIIFDTLLFFLHTHHTEAQPEPFVKTNRKRLKRKNEEKSTRNALAAHRRRWSALLTDLGRHKQQPKAIEHFLLWTIRRVFIFMTRNNERSQLMHCHWVGVLNFTRYTFTLLERERTECSNEKCPSFVIDSCAIHTAIVRSCAHHLTWKVINIVRIVFVWSLVASSEKNTKQPWHREKSRATMKSGENGGNLIRSENILKVRKKSLSHEIALMFTMLCDACTSTRRWADESDGTKIENFIYDSKDRRELTKSECKVALFSAW